jgi:hypothetical protein
MAKEAKRAYNKKWAAANRERLLTYHREYSRLHRRGPISAKVKYSRMVHDAKDRGLEATITLDEYKALQSQPCFYCQGQLPIQGSGLDRIDSSIGYVSGNVRPCCKSCNYAKSDLTESQFKEWILRIYNNWVNK